MKTTTIVLVGVLLLSLVSVQQVNAYTTFDFSVIDAPTSYDNVTYTASDLRLGDEYEWIEFYGSSPHPKLPADVAIANSDPAVINYDYDGRGGGEGWYTTIDRTIEPGTPFEMCIRYDNNYTLSKCERVAVGEEWRSLSLQFVSLILTVDMDAPQTIKLSQGAR